MRKIALSFLAALGFATIATAQVVSCEARGCAPLAGYVRFAQVSATQ